MPRYSETLVRHIERGSKYEAGHTKDTVGRKLGIDTEAIINTSKLMKGLDT